MSLISALMKFERPSHMDEADKLDGTVIVPKQTGEYPIEAFGLEFSHEELKDHGFLVGEILNRRGDDYVELDLEKLALLIWEHKQYCDAQEFSVSTVRIHRAVQEISENRDRILFRDIKSHPLTEKYSSPTIRNGLKKLIKEGFVKKGQPQGEYHYVGTSEYVPSRTVIPLNDMKSRSEAEKED